MDRFGFTGILFLWWRRYERNCTRSSRIKYAFAFRIGRHTWCGSIRRITGHAFECSVEFVLYRHLAWAVLGLIWVTDVSRIVLMIAIVIMRLDRGRILGMLDAPK